MNTGRKTIQIGGAIRNARSIKGLSQEELAEQIDCSVKTISNIENNKIPELKQIINICDVLEISMDKLFDIALPKKKFSNEQEKSYFAQREEAKRNLSSKDAENLNTIIESLYCLNSDQIQVLKSIIDLWK